ncbi:hypothetical protein FE257_005647 [Aspergillus nanangensis]|uniref:B30.2/SPRY domain-containing protein n=1 Tax=Aspergillus nanangensis TaxID=2582783 RepID=A0AAD4CS52_ASPNN|nr:hypothetical protein FE257_005647 [Aspergillus nanangensis]
MGCRLKILAGELEFTKNGRSLGIAFSGVFGRLFPVVGMASFGSGHIRANFVEPFKYNFVEPFKYTSD